MNKTLGTILILVLIAFIVIQFFKPERNNSASESLNDISTKIDVSTEQQKLLETSC
jgi:hypothetical protein